jgi:subtilisin inhibitor-like
MRAVAVLCLTAAALGTSALGVSAAGSAGTSPVTALKVTYWENPAKSSDHQTWTLRCDPIGGTLSRPSVACRRLETLGVKLFRPVPRGAVCTEVYGGPQVARVIGTVEGERVWAKFSRTNGCQIDRWNRLSPWLLPAVRTNT